MQQYNQLIKPKYYLEWLSYDHLKIGRNNTATTYQQIQELIKKLDNSTIP